MPDKQGSLNNIQHLGNCVAAARRKDNKESKDEAKRRDPAVDDAGALNGGWLDMSKNTPFGMTETTAKFAFQSAAWRDAHFHVHHLSTVHRTSEPLLLDALTDLRAGVPGAAAGSKVAPRPLGRPCSARTSGDLGASTPAPTPSRGHTASHAARRPPRGRREAEDSRLWHPQALRPSPSYP